MPEPKHTIINISNRTILRIIVWGVATLVALKLIDQLSHALTLIFTSFFLALALNPVVTWMSNRLKLKGRVRATAAAYLLIIAVIAGFIVLVVPPLVSQTRDFISEFPQTVQNFQNQDSSFSRAAERYNLDERLVNGAKDFASRYGDFGSALLDTGKRILGVVISILVVLVMTFMMLVEGPRWLDLLWRTTPKQKREHRKQLLHRMYKSVSGYVNGQFVLATVAGFFALLALLISSNLLDVSINAIALAGIVALLGLIPMIGNPVGAAIVVLICLLSSPQLALIMLIYFIVYSQIENWTFQPYIQSRLNDLTPLMVFIAAVIGIQLAGFLGAFIAIPAASAIKILIEDQYKRGRFQLNKDAKQD